MNRIYIPYSLILKEKLINEADILQHRTKGLVSKFIKTFTEGEHSHSSMASWSHNGRDILENIEFREWKGGRTVNLEHIVNANPEGIDVYRVSSPITILKTLFDNENAHLDHQGECPFPTAFDMSEISFETETLEFNGRAITNCMRKLTGLPYGYMRIWKIAKMKIPVLRFFLKPDLDDEQSSDKVYPVCSSAIASCYRKHYVDLMHARPDSKTSPADLTRSPLLNYMFTILGEK